MKRLSDRVFYFPHQPEFDRPMLAYLKGSKFSLAIDAGYSRSHVDSFYSALKESGLEKPDFTVITHWHYDHTFGMGHISGASIAHCRTNGFLKDQQEKAADAGYFDRLKQEDAAFAKEYRGQRDPEIVLSDIEFTHRLVLDLGDMTAVIFHTESPHSEDTVCIYVPEEEILFLGDSTSEDFFNDSYMDQAKLQKLIQMIEDTPCRYCILSHADVLKKGDLLDYLATVAAG